MKIVSKFTIGGAFSPDFLSYNPMVGAQQAQQQPAQQAEQKEVKDENEKYKNKMFDLLSAKGLPSDVDKYSVEAMSFFKDNQTAFGGNVSKGGVFDNTNITQLAQNYSMLNAKMNRISEEKSYFDKAKNHLQTSEADNQPAITKSGNMIVLNDKNELSEASPEQLFGNKDKNFKIVTYSDLATMRYSDTKYANNTGMIDIMNNAVGVVDIKKHLTDQIAQIKTDTNTNTGYIDSNTQVLQDGLRLLSSGGVYKSTDSTTTANHKKQVAANYILSTMPASYRVTLEALATSQGYNPKTQLNNMVISLLNNNLENSSTHTIDYEEKLSGGSGGNGNTGTPVQTTQAWDVINDNGGIVKNYVLNPHSDFQLVVPTLRHYDQFARNDDKNKMLTPSTLNEIFEKASISTDFNKESITFGDSRIQSGNIKDIVIDTNKGFSTAYLPAIHNSDDSYTVNTSLLIKVDKADKIIKDKGITNLSEMKKVYRENNIEDAIFEALVERKPEALSKVLTKKFFIFTGYTTNDYNTGIDFDSPFVSKIKSGAENYSQIASLFSDVVNKKENNLGEKGDYDPYSFSNAEIVTAPVYITATEDKTAVATNSGINWVPKTDNREIEAKKPIQIKTSFN